MSLQLENSIKKSFDGIKSAKTRSRGQKLYMTLKFKEWSTNNHSKMVAIKNFVKSQFPHAYLTSFGGDSAVLRLNNEDFPVI